MSFHLEHGFSLLNYGSKKYNETFARMCEGLKKVVKNKK
ncbi:hypothetical protein BREVNS_0766 [Brevinematales bacterium NS]|nr:hypothetical protein BREVNS_0766 [Brevinematales bacterium NS]